LTNGFVKGRYVSMGSININVTYVHTECYRVMNLCLYAVRINVQKL